MNRLRTFLIGLALVTALSLSACSLFRKPSPSPLATPASPLVVSTATPMPTSTPTVEPTAPPPRPVVGYTPVPPDTVSPVVVQRSPEPGQELAPDGGIQLVFDRAMNQSAVESAFAIQPAVAGKFDVDRSAHARLEAGSSRWRATRSTMWSSTNRPRPPTARRCAARTSSALPRRATWRWARSCPRRKRRTSRPTRASPSFSIGPSCRSPRSTSRRTLPQPLTLDPPVPGQRAMAQHVHLCLSAGWPAVGRHDLHGQGQRRARTPTATRWRRITSGALRLSRPRSCGFAHRQVARRFASKPPCACNSISRWTPNRRNRRSACASRGKAVPGTFDIVSNTLTFTPTARLPFDAQVEARVAAGVKSASGGNPSAGAGDYAWSFQDRAAAAHRRDRRPRTASATPAPTPALRSGSTRALTRRPSCPTSR